MSTGTHMAARTRLAGLIARPIAHRGLHAADRGIIENTPSALKTAIAAGYGIELDLQVSVDGEAMVHHDDALGRLTEGTGPLAVMSAAELRRVRYRSTSDRMMTLGEVCNLVSGSVALVLELKSRFDGDVRLVARTAQVLAGYRGPVAAMSFDPQMIEALRHAAPKVLRGIVTQSSFDDPAWNALAPSRKCSLANVLHAPRTRPHFLAYRVDDLPAPITTIARLLGRPVLTWTVRTDAQRRIAAQHADQMIFEGFRP